MIFLFLAHSHLEVRPSTKNQAKTIKSGTLKEPHFLKTRQKFPKIQRTHKPSGMLRSLILPNVPAVFQGSREAYKPSGTPRVSFSQMYQRVFKDPENPTNPLAHPGVSFTQVHQSFFKDPENPYNPHSTLIENLTHINSLNFL